jgi:hypothetical protein
MNQPTTNRNWIWLFVVLAFLACAAIAINLTYNLQQQFRPADLQAARSLWEKHGPKNYDLTIRKEVGSEKANRETLTAKIRNGVTVEVTLNDLPLPERRLWTEYDMPGVFDWIERFLEMDTKPGAPRSFCRARFDPANGHLVHYVRSVRGSGQRQEMTIELTKVSP